jgi:sugar lactone lactonase YvrE
MQGTSRSRGAVIFGGVVALLLAGVVTVVIVVANRSAGQPAASEPSPPPLAGPAKYGAQTALPLNGLVKPEGLAVTPAGDVFVVCCKAAGKAELWIQETGASFPTRNSIPYPFGGIAVDEAGNLFVAELNGIAKLAAGTLDKTMLPFPDPDITMGIAVDGAGAVYVLHSKIVDVNQAKVAAEIWKLEPGATSATVMPLNDVRLVLAVAADQPGNVYVADAAGRRVLKYAPGATDPTDLAVPEGTPNAVAVDESGAVYVAATTAFSDAVVYRYPPDGATPEKLPVTGVHWTPGTTVGVGVDSVGNVYLGDADHDRVVEIPRETG